MLFCCRRILGRLRNTDEPVPVVVREQTYFDDVVRYGVIATALWGVVGFLMGHLLRFNWLSQH